MNLVSPLQSWDQTLLWHDRWYNFNTHQQVCYTISVRTSHFTIWLLMYIQVSYVGKFRLIAPRFETQIWNVHDASLQGQSRTNNVCESWNNGFRVFLGHPSPSIWTVVSCLQKRMSHNLISYNWTLYPIKLQWTMWENSAFCSVLKYVWIFLKYSLCYRL